MKILVAFHSKGGSTKRVAEEIKRTLEEDRHQVDLEEVKPIKDRSFLSWHFLRIIQSDIEIEEPKIKDLSKYDVVVLGSPNWTRVSLPMRRYIRGLEGLRGKSVGLFSATALCPSFEWYILSAHSLFSTFSKAVMDKGGRVIDSILLSGVIKKYNADSKWGKEVIVKFCKKIVSQDERFKESVLLRREIDDIRFLTVFFSTLAFIFISIQAILPVFGGERLRWDHFWIIFLILSSISFIMAGAIERKKNPFLGKFLAAPVLISLWHIILIIAPQNIHGAHMAGYVAIIAFLGIFRNIATVLIAGISSLISYLILFYFYYPHTVRLHPIPDMMFLAAIIVIVIFVTSSIQKYFLGLTDVQDELETSRMSLEIQVRARTRELEELRGGLEKSIEERTSELNKKVKEFEKFNKLIVGREMKMVDLKKKIEELEEEKKS